MLPGMELMGCTLEVPASIMHHVVQVESSYNPYAIGVVRGRLVRQPRSLAEAVATARMLESRGYNFSLGLAQVNRYNLHSYGLTSYEQAFEVCPNLAAGSRILRECHQRAGGEWGKAFSCYYSGNFTTGFRHGYVQKIEASMRAMRGAEVPTLAIPLAGGGTRAVAARQSAQTAGAMTASASSSRTGALPVMPAVMQPQIPVASVSPTLVERRGGFAYARTATPAQAAVSSEGMGVETAASLPAMPPSSAPGVVMAVPTPASASAAINSPSSERGEQASKNGDSAFVF